MNDQLTNQDPTAQTPVNSEPVSQEPIIPPQEVPIIEPKLPPRPEMEITPEPEPQPETTTSSSGYQQVLNQYAANTEKLPIIETPPRSSDQQLQDLGISPPPKTGGSFLKVLFIIALIIFIFVFTGLGLVYFKSQKTEDNSDSSTFDTVKTSPTPISGTCFLNDITYQTGDSFASTDGCNTCSCESQNMIVCTEKACATPTVATKSATVTPTKNITPTSTSSAKKITPTATPSATKN